MALGLALLRTDGYCGAITTRAYMLVTDGESFRTELALPCLELLVDLGSGVMDGAAVDASLQVMSRRARGDIVVVDLRKDLDKALELQRAVSSRANADAQSLSISGGARSPPRVRRCCFVGTHVQSRRGWGGADCGDSPNRREHIR